MKKNASIIIISFLLILVALLIIILLNNNADDSNNPKGIIASNETVVNITKTETTDSVIYEVIDNQKGLTYSWTFEKNDAINKSLKEKMEIDVNLNLNVLTELKDSILDEKVTNKDKLIVSFEHHGKLPSKAKIKLNVNGKYKNGEKLFLYYYNEEAGQIEFVDDNLIVKNGKVEFEIDHCSNYLLTGSIVQDAVNNPKNINLIIIIMVVVIIVLIGATLFQNKK